MPDLGILQLSGAQPPKPTKWFPLSTQKFFSGLWTQRSPFSGPDNRYYSRLLGGRTDILWDGQNIELTNYGTYIRRPGLTQYSSATIPNVSTANPILTFYSFHQQTSTTNPIDVIVDTSNAIYKLNPTDSAASLILNKKSGSGQGFYQGVGNDLYFGDGQEEMVWNDSATVAAANTISGYVNTNGRYVTWTTGPSGATSAAFGDGSVANTNWTGQNIIINGVTYTISGVSGASGSTAGGATGLTLTTSAGTQSAVQYTYLTRKWGIQTPTLAGDSGPLYAEAGVDTTVSGGATWTDPNYISGAPDQTYATITLSTAGSITTSNTPPTSATQSGGSYAWSIISGVVSNVTIPSDPGNTPSNILVCSSCNFNIPVNATIVGVKVVVTKYQHVLSGSPGIAIYDSSVYLSGVYGSQNNLAKNTPWVTDTPTNSTYGGSANLWGAVLTPNIINSSDFGLSIAVQGTSYTGVSWQTSAHITDIEIQVTYTIPSATYSDYLQASVYGFGVTAATGIQGIRVDLTGLQGGVTGNPATSNYTVQLMKNGSLVGTSKTGPAFPNNSVLVLTGVGVTGATATYYYSSIAQGTPPITGQDYTVVGFNTVANNGTFTVAGVGSNYFAVPKGSQTTETHAATGTGYEGTVSLGGNSDTWGADWTSSDVNGSGFGVSIQAVNPASGKSATWSFDAVAITVYGTQGPALTLDSTTGSFTCTQQYGYVISYGNNRTGVGHVSTASPPSQIGPFNNYTGVKITLVPSTDPQVNEIRIFRTKDGGSTYFELPNSPQPNAYSASFEDTATDLSLDTLSIAPIDNANDPPPSGLVNLTYHSGRIWGSVANFVYYSDGPDCELGNGNEAWDPENYFELPCTITKFRPTPQGLLVFTTGDIYIIEGSTSDTYYVSPYLPDTGVLSANAVDFEGSNIFIYTADRQFTSVSAAGLTEIGMGIGNLLESYFDPTKVYVASIVTGSRDKAVFIGAPDNTGAGPTGVWYRCNWNQPPEGGPAWSPQAIITGGFTAMAAVETAPGYHQLLVGRNDGVIMARSYDVFSDLGCSVLGLTGVAATGATATYYYSTVNFGLPPTPGTVYNIGGFAGPGNNVTATVLTTGSTGSTTYFTVVNTTQSDETGPTATPAAATATSSAYPAYLVLGSIILAQPGQLAEVESVTLELPKVGSVPTVGVVLDEVVYNSPGSNPVTFETLTTCVDDPPILSTSQSLYSKRWYLLQGGLAIVGRNLQLKVGFVPEPYRNEIYTVSIWGAFTAHE